MHWSCQATLETVALFGLISLTTQTKGWEYCGQPLPSFGFEQLKQLVDRAVADARAR